MIKLGKIFRSMADYFSYKLFKKHFSDEEWRGICQFIQFSLIGLSNTLINYIVYVILIYAEINYIAASIAGFFVSVVNAFYWNNKWVFKKQENEARKPFRTFIKTFMAYAGTGLVLNNILLVFWVQVLGIGAMIAPILNLLITVPVNFILNKFWAFARKKNK